MDKPFVFDKPLVKTQKFEVSMPNQGYRITKEEALDMLIKFRREIGGK